MPRLRFHLLGELPEGRVRAHWTERTHAVPREAQEAIESAWQAALRRPGIHLFDGPMCRLEGWSTPTDDAGALDLRFSPTSYKAFFGSNLSHPELADRFGADVLANPAGVSPALESADGFLLLGRRNASVAYYPNRIHPFAGALEPDDVASLEHGAAASTPAPDAAWTPAPAGASIGAIDVFSAVRRELDEELALAAADIASIVWTGIAEDAALRQPELIFRVCSRLSRSRIEAKAARDEHDGVWSTPATRPGIERALNEPALTPIAVAALLLWGRAQFGHDWFQDAGRSFVEDSIIS